MPITLQTLLITEFSIGLLKPVYTTLHMSYAIVIMVYENNCYGTIISVYQLQVKFKARHIYTRLLNYIRQIRICTRLICTRLCTECYRHENVCDDYIIAIQLIKRLFYNTVAALSLQMCLLLANTA